MTSSSWTAASCWGSREHLERPESVSGEERPALAWFPGAGTGLGSRLRRECRKSPPALIMFRETSSKYSYCSALFLTSHVT